MESNNHFSQCLLHSVNMYTKIIKFRSNYALLLLLVAAFLSMQWTTAHIHLGEQHNHDGSHHQHQVEAHAYHLTDQAVDASDSSHQASHTNIIDFYYEYSVSKRENQKDSFDAVITPEFNPPPSLLLARIEIPALITVRPGYFARSTVNPRAPPQTS